MNSPDAYHSLRDWLRNRPFVPFEVKLRNGEAVRLSQPGGAAMSPQRVYFVVPDSDRILDFDMAAVVDVAALSMKN